MDTQMLVDVAKIIGSSVVKDYMPPAGWMEMNGLSCVILPYVLWRLRMKLQHAVITTGLMLLVANLMYRYFIVA